MSSKPAQLLNRDTNSGSVEVLAIKSRPSASAQYWPLALVAHISTKAVASILHLLFCSTVLISGCATLGLHS